MGHGVWRSALNARPADLQAATTMIRALPPGRVPVGRASESTHRPLSPTGSPHWRASARPLPDTPLAKIKCWHFFFTQREPFLLSLRLELAQTPTRTLIRLILARRAGSRKSENFKLPSSKVAEQKPDSEFERRVLTDVISSDPCCEHLSLRAARDGWECKY